MLGLISYLGVSRAKLGHVTVVTIFDDPQAVVPVLTRGQRLRIARENAGFEQGEFAELIGISRNTVSNYENGRKEVRRTTVVTWAKATKVPFSWLMGEDYEGPGTGKPAPKDRPDLYTATDLNCEPAVILPHAA